MDNLLLKKLINDGSTVLNNIILLNINELHITPEEFLVYSTLEMYSQKGNKFPTPAQLSKHTGLQQNSIFNIIQNLVQKRIITIKTIINSNHQQQDIYDLSVIYELLEKIYIIKEQEEKIDTLKNETEELFKSIEVEFGRPLSPIEQETIHSWIKDDNYSIELIKLALRESVLNQVYSLKYIDRILLNWEKQNIKTAQQLEDKKNRGEI